MNNFIFENATKVYFGKGCVKEYLSCLAKRHGEKVFLAYGGGSIKRNGIYDEVVSILEEAGKEIIEFSGIMANPTYAKVLEGAELARENQADWILGVGGGSVMDCCKAVSMAAVSKKDVWDEYWAKPGVIDFELLPLGVIVTVAGTGSECNHGAEIPYVFDHKQDNADAQKFADQVSQAWINFAKTGVPSADGLPEWEPYDNEKGATMILDKKSSLRYGHDRELMKLLKNYSVDGDIQGSRKFSSDSNVKDVYLMHSKSDTEQLIQHRAISMKKKLEMRS